MPQELFRTVSLHEEMASRTRSAVALVDRLPVEKLTEANRDAEAVKLCDLLKIDVPVMAIDKKTGKRRTELRRVRDYGMTSDVEVSFIDVTIPYTGDFKGFGYQPTRSRTGLMADVRAPGIVITLEDDERLEARLADLLKSIGETLETILHETERFPEQMKGEVLAAMKQRHDKIVVQQERDANRSFPIT